MKKSWRAILCGVMAIAMTASLAGCGSSDDSSSESDSSSAAETTAADSSTADESSTDADSSSDESSESSSDDSSTADESSVVYGNYEIEAEDGVDSACADVIKAYFTAIEEQDFDASSALPSAVASFTVIPVTTRWSPPALSNKDWCICSMVVSMP